MSPPLWPAIGWVAKGPFPSALSLGSLSSGQNPQEPGVRNRSLGAEMGSKGGLVGRLGAGIREQSKGVQISSFLPAIRGIAWFLPGCLDLSERDVGAGAAYQGASREEVEGIWGFPVQTRTLGPGSREAPIPQPHVLATELSFRAGCASTAAGGPLPLACLNLAPPQATRPLPHPLVSVWGDRRGGPPHWKGGLLFSVV